MPCHPVQRRKEKIYERKQHFKKQINFNFYICKRHRKNTPLNSKGDKPHKKYDCNWWTIISQDLMGYTERDKNNVPAIDKKVVMP